MPDSARTEGVSVLEAVGLHDMRVRPKKFWMLPIMVMNGRLFGGFGRASVGIGALPPFITLCF